MGNEGENVQRLVPEFEKQNPGIKIKVQQIPWTAAHEKLLTAFAGNSLPDICALGNTWIPEFSMLHALESLDGRIKRSDKIRPENYFAGIWDTNVIDSVAFGIPWYVDTRLIYYRTDILEKAGYSHAPRTWDEWYDVSGKIVRNAGRKDRYAVLLPTNEWAPFVIAGLESGSHLLKDGNRYGDFSGPEFSRSFAYLMRFYRDKLSPVGVTQVTNIYQGISEGFFSMYITGPWNIGEFRRRLPAVLQDKWMTAPMPGPSRGEPGVSLAGGSSIVLFAASKNKESSWKFIEYLSTVKRQVEFYDITGDLPAVADAWKDTSLANNKYIKAFYEQLQHVVATPKIPEWERIAMKVQQYAELASTGSISEKESLDNLDKDVNTILEKHRWMMDRKRHD